MRAPNNGMYIAKLIQETHRLETATEIFDIFEGTPNKEKRAAPYAAYARTLVQSNCLEEATRVLLLMDDQRFADLEIEEAKNQFFFPDPADE